MQERNLIIICIVFIGAYFIGYTLFRSSKLKEPAIQINIEDAQKCIEKTLSTKAEFFPDEQVIKVSFPRKDITVTIDKWPLDPFMGLSSWIAFQKGTKKGVEIM